MMADKHKIDGYGQLAPESTDRSFRTKEAEIVYEAADICAEVSSHPGQLWRHNLWKLVTRQPSASESGRIPNLSYRYRPIDAKHILVAYAREKAGKKHVVCDAEGVPEDLSLGVSSGLYPNTIPDSKLIVPPDGISFKNYFVDGLLNFDGISIDAPILFENCVFQNGVVLRDCTSKTVAFRNCFIPFVSAERITCSGSFAVRGSFVPMGIRIDGSQFQGGVLFYGTTVCSPKLFDRAKQDSGTIPKHGLQAMAILEACSHSGIYDCLPSAKNGPSYATKIKEIHTATAGNKQNIRAHHKVWEPLFLFRQNKEIARQFGADTLFASGRQIAVTEFQSSCLNPVFEYMQSEDRGFRLDRYIGLMSDKAVAASNIDVRQDVNCSKDFVEGASNSGDRLSGDKCEPVRPKQIRRRFSCFGRFSMPSASVRGIVKFNSAKLINFWVGDKLGRAVALKLDGSEIKGSLELNATKCTPLNPILDPFESYGTVRALGLKIGGALVCESASFSALEPVYQGKTERDVDNINLWKNFQAIAFEQCEVAGTIYFRPELKKLSDYLMPTGIQDSRDKGFDYEGVQFGHVSFRDTSCLRLADRLGKHGYYEPARLHSNETANKRHGRIHLDGFRYEAFTDTHIDVSSRPILRPLVMELLDFRDRKTKFLWGVVVILLWQISSLYPEAITLLRPLALSFGIFFLPVVVLSPRLARLLTMGAESGSDRIEDWLHRQAPWLLESRDRHSRKGHADPSAGFRGQPFEALATALERVGDVDEARRVRIVEALNRTLQMKSGFRRELQRFLGVFAHFGYNVWRPLHLLIITLTLSVWLFSHAHYENLIVTSNEEFLAANAGVCVTSAAYEDSVKNGIVVLDTPYPEFSPLTFVIDSAVPFVDLNQRNYWAPWPHGSGCVESPVAGHQGRRLSSPLENQFFTGFFGSADSALTTEFLSRWLRLVIFVGWILLSITVAGLAGLLHLRD